MVNRKLRKSKSTLVSVRIPNQLLDELDNICERMPCSTMSNIIVSAMAREIVRIKGVLWKYQSLFLRFPTTQSIF